MKNHLLVVTRRHFLRDQESIEFKKRVEKNHVERMGNSLSFINVNETMKQIKYQISMFPPCDNTQRKSIKHQIVAVSKCFLFISIGINLM